MIFKIIGTCIIFLVLITTTGCFKKEVLPPPINSYAVEKSAYYKHGPINDKIINETNALFMSYPFSMQILLLTDEAITRLIPLSDKGVMSQEYYLNAYNEEQNLIYEMFKKRKTFTKLRTEYVESINTVSNNKNYDFVMYFDSSTIGELDIYLKDTKSNRTFLVWKEGMTKIEPIQKVENILKSKMLYCDHAESEKVQPHKSVKVIKSKNLKNKQVQHEQNANHNNQASQPSPATKNIAIKQESSSYGTTKDLLTKTKDIQQHNYYNAKKDSSGCYAYGALNQCIVW
ncbi:MAG: hypothetical protein OQK48_07700 [Sulfurimonas sp.]|nr:hypothetical protein [Sulfurimonas sp.]